MLKQVQHDNRIGFSSFCHPELGSGSRFWVLKPGLARSGWVSEEASSAQPFGGLLHKFRKETGVSKITRITPDCPQRGPYEASEGIYPGRAGQEKLEVGIKSLTTIDPSVRIFEIFSRPI
jgi:hypothetical protein